MAGPVAAAVLLILLLLLEWLFWLSPLKASSDRLMRWMGSLYLLLPFHYLARLAALAAVLALFRPPLWHPFTGGLAWLSSLALGAALAILSTLAYLRLDGVAPGLLAAKWRAWHRESPKTFWKHLLYITAFPGLVEELLFRWFFVAALWPVAGWWGLVAGPLVNLVWHLPVWIDMVHSQAPDRPGRRRLLMSVAGPAALFAVLLTLITVLTQNLLGAVLAHAACDFGGAALRRRDSGSKVAG